MNAFGRCTKCHDFPHKTRLQCEINLVSERAGFGLTGPCSDHGVGRAPRLISGVSFSLRFASERVVVVLLFAVLLCCVFNRSGKQIPSSNYVPLTLESSAPARPVLLVFISPLGAQQQFLQWIFWLAGPANSSALHGAACGNVTSIWAADIKETPRQSHLDVLDLDTSEMVKFTALANQWIRILVQLARLPCVVGPQEFE